MINLLSSIVVLIIFALFSSPSSSESDVTFFVGLLFSPPKIEPQQEPKPIALQSVTTYADVRAWAVGVTANLTYRNTLNQTIECQFVFPMADTAAVYQLEAVFGDGRKIKAEVMARDEAEKVYNTAIQSGQRAVLLQSQKGSTDIYRLLLGNLAPNETATVTVGYAQPLDRDPDNSLLTLTLPVVLNPRYIPQHELNDPEAMKRNFQSTTPYVAVSQVSYAMKFSAKIDLGMEGTISDIKPGNSADSLTIDYQGPEDARRSADVRLTGNFRQDHDFRLLISTKKVLNSTTVYIEPGLADQGDESGVAYPWLSYHIAAAWFEPVEIDQGTNAASSNNEYWFIIDRSGSMDGQKIVDAREALLLLIRSLPFGCKFNIIGFGTTFEVLFNNNGGRPVAYNENTMKTAVSHAERITADLGGTEVLESFQYVYRQTVPEGSKRFIVILTDGEVSNTDEVIETVQRNKATTRVFAIGIGEGASTALIDGVSRVSNGMADYVRSASDRLQSKVIALLKATTFPSADNFSLKWHVSGGQIVLTEPSSLPVAAFHGKSVMQYAVIQPTQKSNITASVEMKATMKAKPINFKTSFNIPANTGDSSMPLHRLAAKARLVNLTDDYKELRLESVKQEAIAVSIATGVLCEFTSFVAVDKETRRPLNDSQGKPLRVNIERPSEYNWAPNYYGSSSNNYPSRSYSGSLGSSPVRIVSGSAGSYGGLSGYPGYYRQPMPSSSYDADLEEYDAADEGDFDSNFAVFMTTSLPAMYYHTSTMYLPTFFTTTMFATNRRTSSFQDKTTTGRAATTTTTTTTKRPITLQQLLNLQNFDGSWPLNQALVGFVSKPTNGVTDSASLKAAIRKAVTGSSGNLSRASDAAFGTLSAVAILRHQFAASRDEWQMIEDKAVRFLRSSSSGLPSTANIDSYIDAIANALQLQ